MPTILTHPAVPLALGLGLGGNVIPKRLLLAGVAASILPDLDVIAFKLGIPYAAEFGHRGFSHSLLSALLVALLGATLSRWLHSTFWRAFPFLLLAAASHGLLDTLTNGGLGIALLWPFSEQRYFAPLQMIEVAPINAAKLFTARGLVVLKSELFWVWLPALSTGLLLWLGRYVVPQRSSARA